MEETDPQGTDANGALSGNKTSNNQNQMRGTVEKRAGTGWVIWRVKYKETKTTSIMSLQSPWQTSAFSSSCSKQIMSIPSMATPSWWEMSIFMLHNTGNKFQLGICCKGLCIYSLIGLSTKLYFMLSMHRFYTGCVITSL